MDPVIVSRDFLRHILIGHADGFYWFITEQRYAQNPKHDKWAGAQGAFFVA